MKILYLIDTKKYTYHKNIIEDFKTVIDGEVMDLSNISDLGSAYHSIDQFKPNVIIIFDLIGHEFKTGNGTLSLNGIYCRIANVLFQKVQVYGNETKLRQNLSSFMYISERDDVILVKDNCPDVPNIDYLKGIQYKISSEEEHLENQNKISLWWQDFKKEAMINEDTNI